MADRDQSEQARDPSRREFFRTISRQTVQQAGTLVGTAAEFRRAGLAAAQGMLDPQTAAAPTDAPEWTFRSPYRFTGTDIVMVDQRDLPGRVVTVTVREPSEVASAMRVGAINGGPVLGEVAAYAFTLAWAGALVRNEASRRQHMRAAAGTLRATRPEIRALAAAVDRIEARYDEVVNSGAEADSIAAALRAEADAITSDAMAAHAQIGRAGAAAIQESPGEVANLLMHGDMGPMSCGMVGMGTALLKEVQSANRPLHVWLSDAGPSGEGARISAHQLTQLDIPHTVIPDSAVGWLFAHRQIDALLLRGDRVCRNGDTGTLIGGLSAARLAAASSVPVIVLAPRAAFDDGASTGSDIDVALRSPAEMAQSAVVGGRLEPRVDVVPAPLISTIVAA